MDFSLRPGHVVWEPAYYCMAGHFLVMDSWCVHYFEEARDNELLMVMKYDASTVNNGGPF